MTERDGRRGWSIFSRRRRPRTLWARLSLLFALIFLVFSFFSALVCRAFWLRADSYVLANRYAPIAGEIAAEIQAHLDPELHEGAARAAVRHALRFAPEIDVYVLQPDGRIEMKLDSNGSVVSTDRVDPKPVELFLSIAPYNRDYLFGNDPSSKHPDRADSAFSAATIRLQGQPRYLYAVLGNQRGRRVLQLAQEGAIIRGGGAVILGLTAGAILLTVLMVRLTTNRFSRLAAAVQIIRDGDLRARVPVTGSDELSTLGRAINEMANTIEQNVAALERKDSTRRQLIANIWHDIKAPITGISALAQRLSAEVAGAAPETERCCKGIVKNVEALAVFLNELRELSELEAREAVPHMGQVSCALLADDLELAIKHRADAAGVTLQLDVPESLPTVRADLIMIERVITNLLENAFRHTGAGGTVSFIGRETAAGVRLSVQDTGAGIRVEELSRIFERHYQSAEGEAPVGSAGLGLAIVQKILEHHDSTIEVESEVGKGTVFAFELPRFAVAGG